ncbi:MAG: DNA primase [Lachnospiraceae bacterium]|nr:DNA primase [Lachnospiraceae bacterium]
MYYSDETIEEVRNRNDIVGVISQVVNLKKKSGRYFGLCPFHNEKTGSFSVSSDKQMYYCFGCHKGGNVISFVMDYEGYSFQEAVEFLAERSGITLPKEDYGAEQRREAGKRARILAMYKDAAIYYYKQLRNPVGQRAKKYFEGRQLSDETQNKWGLGYAPSDSSGIYKYLKDRGHTDETIREAAYLTINERGCRDPFWNRAMFPIMNNQGKVIGFGGRVMGDGEPKYYNSKESPVFDKSRNLYGLNFARSSRRPYMLLCEGYMDVIALHQAGFDCAVASLGTAFTSGHAALLKRYVDEVILTFDSDGAGQRAILRAIPILKGAGLRVKVIDMKPYKDPDEFITYLGAENFEERISRSINAVFFEIDTVLAEHDISDPDSKTDFFKQAAGIVAGIEDKVERENYVLAVAERYAIPGPTLRELVNYIGSSREMGGERSDAFALKGRTVKKTGKKLGISEAENVVILWMLSTDKTAEQIEKTIGTDCFSEGVSREISELILKNKKQGKNAAPASLLDELSDDNEKRDAAAALLGGDLPGDGDEARRLVSDNIKLLKKEHINELLKTEKDPVKLQNLIRERAMLDRSEPEI